MLKNMECTLDVLDQLIMEAKEPRFHNTVYYFSVGSACPKYSGAVADMVCLWQQFPLFLHQVLAEKKRVVLLLFDDFGATRTTSAEMVEKVTSISSLSTCRQVEYTDGCLNKFAHYCGAESELEIKIHNFFFPYTKGGEPSVHPAAHDRSVLEPLTILVDNTSHKMMELITAAAENNSSVVFANFAHYVHSSRRPNNFASYLNTARFTEQPNFIFLEWLGFLTETTRDTKNYQTDMSRLLVHGSFDEFVQLKSFLTKMNGNFSTIVGNLFRKIEPADRVRLMKFMKPGAKMTIPEYQYFKNKYDLPKDVTIPDELLVKLVSYSEPRLEQGLKFLSDGNIVIE